MRTYKEFRPTSFDVAGLGCDDRQDWLVASCGQNRDSGPLDRSNFECCQKSFAAIDPSGDDWEVHRFGHWGPGWFEIILVRPDTRVAKDAEEIEGALSDYPVLNDEHFSEVERAEADETWANCYRPEDRIEYIREHRSQFEFHSFAELLSCVRGKFFAGYASELLG